MALKFKIGDDVQQVVPVIKGKIVKPVLVGNDVCYEVEFPEGDELHSRVFKEDEIEGVTA
jgi:hypothetical protein